MKSKHYNSRVWLNSDDKSSTGSIVAFHGKSDWSDKDASFLEVADCHGKVRIHKTDSEDMDDYLAKLQNIVNEVEAFMAHLERLES